MVSYGSTSEDTANPSSLADYELLDKLKKWFRADSSHSAKWRKEAREDFDFVAGPGQWETGERAALEQSERVPITFNMTLRFIKAVAGTEINGRHEIRYIPRTREDAKPNEVLTAASKWMSDGCDAEDEESEAFQNSMICGMGWTENRLDYELDAEGIYIEESINPLEMFWDCKARKKNLVDSRRQWRARKMLLSDAKTMFPDALEEDLDARWATGAVDLSGEAKGEEEKRRRDENTEPYDDDSEVTIVECQWWEREDYWMIADPMTGSQASLSEGEYKTVVSRLKQMGQPSVKGVKLTRRVYKRCYIGEAILDKGPAPCKDHFSWQCITGEPDKNAGTWFGLVRIARDPQKWGNKWLTQTLHILNSSAKGGVMAEKDAFDDQRQAEESWARNDRITWMKKGALSGQAQKIQPKPAATFPAGYFNLMQFAFDAVPQVLGINMELMGMRDVNQPGILEAQRKQAAMTILATMFDSLRRFRKLVGRVRLYFIQEFFSDGRLIRVVGQDGAQSVPLIKDKTAGKYDVIVDDAPTSPNQKEANWAIIQGFLPVFQDKLLENPEAALKVMEYSPLPTGFVDDMRALIEKPNPQAEKQAMLAERAAMAQISKDEGAALKAKADAHKTIAETGMNPDDPQSMIVKMQDMLADISKKMAEAEKTKAETQKTQMETMLIPAELEMERQDRAEDRAMQERQNFAQNQITRENNQQRNAISTKAVANKPKASAA